MAKSTSKLFQSEEPKEMKEDAMNLPAKKVEESKKKVEDNVVDLDISAIKKKRFRINGDPNKILELNTSDLNITSRLSSSYEKLVKHMEEVGKVLSALPDDDNELTEDKEKVIREKLHEIDVKMREELDFIFDAPVSAVCSDGGSMYDPFEGMFRYEHIIDALTKLYESNLNAEFIKMKKRINTKTSKYVTKYHN